MMKKILAILLTLFLVYPVFAAPIINPSVSEQSNICKHWYSKWLCDIAPKGDPGSAGAPGEPGTGNNTTYNYYNASLNLTSFSNETGFYNSTIGNLTAFSNITNFYNASNFTSISNTSNYYNTSQTGSSDHHLLSNLTTGDDHTQYFLTNGSRIYQGDFLINTTGGIIRKIYPVSSTGSAINGGSIEISGIASGGTQANRFVSLGYNDANNAFHEMLSVHPTTLDMATYGNITMNVYPGANNNVLNVTSPGVPYIYFTKTATYPGIASFYNDGSFHLNGDNTFGVYISGSDIGFRGSAGGSTILDIISGRVGIGTTSPSTQLHTTGGVRFANFGAGAATFDANGVISSVSDEKAKTDLNSFTKGLKELLQINPIIYKYTSESGLDTKNNYVGFSAQNLQSAVPEIVYSKPDVKYETEVNKNKDGFNESKTIEVPIGTNTLSIYDRGLMAVMVNAIKEQQTQIDDQQKQIDDLKIRLEKLDGSKI